MEIGQITCYGCTRASADWYHHNLIGVNRLYYIHGGTGGCRHNGKDYEFRADTLYFIPYAEDFHLRTAGDDPVLHTYMDFELFPPLMTREVLTAVPGEEPLLQSALTVFRTGGTRMTGKQVMGAEETALQLWKAAAVHLVACIARDNNVPLLQDAVVLQALEIMHRRMEEPMTVEQLAKNSYMNTDSFIRRFSAAMGITPYAYLKRLRLNTARLLRQEGMDLTRIAQRTGYADASALLHALKRAERAVFE